MSRRRRRTGALRRRVATARAAAHPPRPLKRAYALEFASPIMRAYGFAADLTVVFVLFVVLSAMTGGRLGSPSYAVPDVFIFFGYFVFFTGAFGQTPGKYAAGIVVVNREGRLPGVAAAIPREMAGRFISLVALGLGLLWILYDQKRQGWHDKLAGTYVVVKPNSGVPGLLGRFTHRGRK